MLYQAVGLEVIMSRIAADVGHQDFPALALEAAVGGIVEYQAPLVAVAYDSDQGLELCNLGGCRETSAYVPGVPDFIHRLEKAAERLVKTAVRVRYYSYLHGLRLKFRKCETRICKNSQVIPIILNFAADSCNNMELFFAYECDGLVCRLDRDEAGHCVKVLRHRCGDEINVIDGKGTLCRCILTDDSPNGCSARVTDTVPEWGSHPYRLTLAVCPTKNNDRYEWFAEKATEIGVDTIVPVIGDHSERKVFKGERLRRILLSAAKQSLKARIPALEEPVSVADFIRNSGDGLKLIACCFEDEKHPRISIRTALEASDADDISILIGPEGDFSGEELALALGHGFVPVHLGASRLRTETAGITAAEAVYFKFL